MLVAPARGEQRISDLVPIAELHTVPLMEGLCSNGRL